MLDDEKEKKGKIIMVWVAVITVFILGIGVYFSVKDDVTATIEKVTYVRDNPIQALTDKLMEGEIQYTEN